VIIDSDRIELFLINTGTKFLTAVCVFFQIFLSKITETRERERERDFKTKINALAKLPILPSMRVEAQYT
jgi:hypothetical protein